MHDTVVWYSHLVPLLKIIIKIMCINFLAYYWILHTILSPGINSYLIISSSSMLHLMFKLCLGFYFNEHYFWINWSLSTFYFDIISNLWRSCKNSTKNFHKSFNYIHQMLTIYDMCFIFSIDRDRFAHTQIFFLGIESEFQTRCSFTPKYFSVFQKQEPSLS